MAEYRKKPIVVEAMLFDGSMESQRAIVNWTIGLAEGFFDTEYHLVIRTREGSMRVSPGDWVIAEPFPSGTRFFYPCKPDIFEATYEAVA